MLSVLAHNKILYCELNEKVLYTKWDGKCLFTISVILNVEMSIEQIVNVVKYNKQKWISLLLLILKFVIFFVYFRIKLTCNLYFYLLLII